MTNDMTELRSAEVYRHKDREFCGEWIGPRSQGSSEVGHIVFREVCAYPFSQEGVCVNRKRHTDPLACLGKPTWSA